MADETKGSKDKSSAEPGDTSGGTKGTPKDKGKLYTDAQIAKFKSDAAAEAGRQRKAAEQERDSLKQELESNNSRLDVLEREANESRLAEARGDPDQLRSYQRDQATTKRERDAGDKERDLARREAQVKADRAEVDKDKGVVSVAYIAAKHGMEVEELEELGISDPEALEKVAVKLAAAKTPAKPGDEGGEGEGDGEGGEGVKEWSPDSGETRGVVGAPTPEQLEKMSMAQYAAYVAKRDEEKPK